MMKNESKVKGYTAKNEYLQSDVADTYMSRRHYSGFLGKIRQKRENNAVMSAVQRFMPKARVLDMPCGYGRWFDFLAVRADKILGMDISESMINAAAKKKINKIHIKTSLGDAENIPVEDREVDYVFSFAFMKHLPDKVKSNAIDEFVRVSSGSMIISFPVFNLTNKLFWILQGRTGFPNTEREIEEMLHKKGLVIKDIYKIGLPVVGLEKLFFIEKK
jgi:ubiquinone/menaquinone biosynthesis C-methylase UbiE